MSRQLVLGACLALGIALAWWASSTPSPRAQDAPLTAFSAQRALRHVEAIAQEPHPIGSAGHARVREVLISRLRALGLETQVHRGEGVYDQSAPPHSRIAFAMGAVQNIVAVLPGRSHSASAVFLMAHYDSVPNSAGAGDDASGVATAIEVVRALRYSGQRERDVILLLTDGEEPGLLGAQAFFAEDPLRERVGVLINLEARGDRGRAAMFETSPASGNLIPLLSSTAPSPFTNSMMTTFYQRMPNGTDATVPIGRGMPVLNFAFAGNQFAYHSPASVPASLDPGSLQHMGEQVLGLAGELANAQQLPVSGPDVVYSDLLGLTLIWYPVWAGWVLILIAAAAAAFATFRAWRARMVTAWELVRGALGPALICAAAALALLLINPAADYSDPSRTYALLARYPLVLASSVGLTLGIALSIIAAMAGGRMRWWICGCVVVVTGACILIRSIGPHMVIIAQVLAAAVVALVIATLGRRTGAWGSWLGGIMLGLLLATALQVLAPLAAFIVTWPVLAASVIAAIFARTPAQISSTRALVGTGLAGAVVLAVVAYWAGFVFTAVGATLPLVLAFFAPLAGFALMPAAHAAATSRLSVTISILVTLGGAAGLVAAQIDRRASVEQPRLTQLFYFADIPAGKFYRASTLPQLDPWSSAALSTARQQPTRTYLAPFFPQQAWTSPAAPVAIQPPVVRVQTSTSGETAHATIHIQPSGGGRELRVRIKATALISNAAVNARPQPRLAARPGEWLRLNYHAPPADGITLTFDIGRPGQVQIDVAEIREGWPAGAAAVPPVPRDHMPFGQSHSTLAVNRVVLEVR